MPSSSLLQPLGGTKDVIVLCPDFRKLVWVLVQEMVRVANRAAHSVVASEHERLYLASRILLELRIQLDGALGTRPVLIEMGLDCKIHHMLRSVSGVPS